ncbi:MAG: ATP-binding protein [Candidatus Neomarinimicrobiota bacterium]|nr:MAG: sensor histidine kinase [bacterium]|tara:strand:- start:2076 stop:3251 length:1176 start_codon:yes stop_codon:yes gene_type:complete
MKRYTGSTTIKIVLLFFGLILMAGTIFYSNSIVAQLREDNRQIVTVYSRIIANTVNEESDANLGFVFDEIIKKVQFPIIYTDKLNNPLYSRNIDQDKNKDELLNHIKSMNKSNKPIAIEYYNAESKSTILLGYLYFGDSILVQRLEWLPYLEIIIVLMFILVGFLGFNSIRENEKRQIWVGMARETAHQLGTPISALIGWIDRIDSHPKDSQYIAKEMRSDMMRLEQIADRFSQMGSQSPLEKLSLSKLIDGQVKYLKKRIPSLNKDTELKIKIIDDIYIMGNSILLSWALENLIRNAIDSIKQQNGVVELIVKIENGFGCIDIKDNGLGIDRKDWKNIFIPGFSSKKRGWGLGLSLVQRIIKEIHSGSIAVKSSSASDGTTFRIKLDQQR